MTSDLISVIVPCYKHESFIIDCLKSIHRQTYKSLELIVIDDNSPDRTFDFATALLSTAFSHRFENVVIRSHTVNSGTHTSLNEGLSLANGSYIAIINSDDLYKPNRIKRLLDAMIAEESEFAFSAVDVLTEQVQVSRVSSSLERAQKHVPEDLLLLRLRQALSIAREYSIGYALMRQNVAISTGNFMFSKRLAVDIGGFKPLRYCHDWDFILQALLQTEPVFVNEVLYDYRLHHTNTFRHSQYLAQVETEVVLRRFFRAVASGEVKNDRCPSPEHHLGYFEAFLQVAKYTHFWARENAIPVKAQRVCQVEAGELVQSSIGFDKITSILRGFDVNGSVTQPV